MNDSLEFIISDLSEAKAKWRQIGETVKKGLESGAVVLTLGREHKSKIALYRRTYHAMIQDIANQATMDCRKFEFEVWKAFLVTEFEEELRSQGVALSKPGRMEYHSGLRRYVSIRPSSEEFTVKERRGFIQFVDMRGAELGVRFSTNKYMDYLDAE